MATRKAPARKAAPRKKPAETPEPTVDETQKAAKVTQQAPPDHPGFVGDVPDETPNEHYTLSGVNAELPVPEHDK